MESDQVLDCTLYRMVNSELKNALTRPVGIKKFDLIMEAFSIVFLIQGVC